MMRDAMGLSPRMRGNRDAQHHQPDAPGSIPAYAGEPAAGRGRSLPPTVYPRVCGGTQASAGIGAKAEGLSPRMRGNHWLGGGRGAGGGSIPAYAGEPRFLLTECDKMTVYPRVCGGTPCRITCHLSVSGLSPRMRGNRPAVWRGLRWAGSIPAYAGEPSGRMAPAGSSGVYPRVCGGTGADPVRVGDSGGLSPRMRGNRCALRWA